MEFISLFKQINIKGLELKNRIVMPAMGTYIANDDNTISEQMCDYYVARAKGGAALIIVEVTEVHGSSLMPGMCSLHEDRVIPSWTKLTTQIHEVGGLVAAQIRHPGRQIVFDDNRKLLAPSTIPCPICQITPNELTLTEIQDLISSFGDAAYRGKKAGLDAIEIHGAHGYLIAEFMSPYSNKRIDGYGGGLHRRIRFAIEVIEDVREKVGPDFPIFFRISADERVFGGRTTQETVAIVPWLVKAGVDVIDVSTGVFSNLYTYIVPPMQVSPGLNINEVAMIKEAVDIPVIASGRLNDPMIAESVLARGKADLIAIGRSLIADPEWPRKVKEGKLDDICWCISCNQGCIEKPRFSEKIMGGRYTCTVNPASGREKEMNIKSSAKPNKCMVIGGGPAGMEVAKIAAQRGHIVDLYEKSDKLGGQFLYASYPPGKQEITKYLTYQISQLQKLNVKIHLNCEVTSTELKKSGADIIVIATGGHPSYPNISAVLESRIADALDVLSGKFNIIELGTNIAIVGGGMVGCEIADFLSEYNKNITIIEYLPDLLHDVGPSQKHFLLNRIKDSRVNILKSAKVLKIEKNNLIYECEGNERVLEGFDTIIIAIGRKPEKTLIDEAKKVTKHVYVVGDALKPSNAMEAIFSGSIIGREL